MHHISSSRGILFAARSSGAIDAETVGRRSTHPRVTRSPVQTLARVGAEWNCYFAMHSGESARTDAECWESVPRTDTLSSIDALIRHRAECIIFSING